MRKIQDDIVSYREMCDIENAQTLQRGMNFRMNQSYSVILMSQRSNAPYQDKIHDDGITIEYEGHDISRKSHDHNPTEVKREVWRRDDGRCVLCGDTKNLHFDHDLPFSKGGTSLSSMNVKILCMKHNLQKSDKIG